MKRITSSDDSKGLAAASADMILSATGCIAQANAKVPVAELENRMRALHCLFGMLRNQQNDEFCRTCKSFAATLASARKQLIAAETRMRECNCRENTRCLFLSVYSILGDIVEPDNPMQQRKLGACRLPDGACLLAASAHLAGCG